MIQYVWKYLDISLQASPNFIISWLFHKIVWKFISLNDVEEGGSTYFNHYDLDIKPKKGLTLIWPAEWTHSHKGNVLKTGFKYIITGWLTFPK